jgi:hypothetical protein
VREVYKRHSHVSAPGFCRSRGFREETMAATTTMPHSAQQPQQPPVAQPVGRPMMPQQHPVVTMQMNSGVFQFQGPVQLNAVRMPMPGEAQVAGEKPKAKNEYKAPWTPEARNPNRLEAQLLPMTALGGQSDSWEQSCALMGQPAP